VPNTQFFKQQNIWYQILYILCGVYLHSAIRKFYDWLLLYNRTRAVYGPTH